MNTYITKAKIQKNQNVDISSLNSIFFAVIAIISLTFAALAVYLLAWKIYHTTHGSSIIISVNF